MAADYLGKAVVEHLPELLLGFRTTVVLSAASMALGLAVGTILAVLRLLPAAALRAGARFVIEFFRNVPILIQLFFYYFGLPRLGISLSAFTCALLGLSIYSGVYVAEAIRAGVLVVGPGQVEAALATGLSRLQALRHIVLPQAVRLVIPPLTNLLVFTIKTSALASAITVEEVMYASEVIESATFRTLEIFTATAGFYLLLTIPLGGVSRRLERRLALRR
jgi:putative glutamine transport system permease protein